MSNGLQVEKLPEEICLRAAKTHFSPPREVTAADFCPETRKTRFK